jgi:hypothetical protein
METEQLGDYQRNEWKSKKLLESNENENTTYQTLSNIVISVLRRKFIRMSAYIKGSRSLSSK